MPKSILIPDFPEAVEVVRITATIDRPTLDALDAHCQVTGMPRAEALRRAARMYLAREAAK